MEARYFKTRAPDKETCTMYDLDPDGASVMECIMLWCAATQRWLHLVPPMACYKKLPFYNCSYASK